MGENHNKYLKLHNIVIDYDNILPVPINVPIINYYKAKNREKIIICYIGRPEIWKINPIIKVLNDLKKTTLYTQVNIISNDTDEYKRYIDDKFDVKFISGIYGDKLTAYLIENVDIQIGMGTTLLESGKLGIPTIVVDASYTKMADNYKYKWLFRNKSHDLGEEILFNLSTSEGEDLKDLIEMYLNDSKSISNKTYNYVKNEHDRTLITNKLLKSLSDSSLKAKEVWLLITFLKIKNKISNKLFGNANKPT